MNKQAFLEKWRYELAGLVFDYSLSERTGAEKALQFRTVMGRVDRMLAEAWDAAAKSEEPKPGAKKP